ncbi:hypothetical protein EVAR_11824_1 [Eumeta japonica]|uniref:Uncharacterized protein n=1 Tax=Eumeta variegata TaxID=151549 RepID=A0A4C1UPG5_EUMVA|nr:hypothetical protein EVAR_11824_1 [Eumeta japonica]
MNKWFNDNTKKVACGAHEAGYQLDYTQTDVSRAFSINWYSTAGVVVTLERRRPAHAFDESDIFHARASGRDVRPGDADTSPTSANYDRGRGRSPQANTPTESAWELTYALWD